MASGARQARLPCCCCPAWLTPVPPRRASILCGAADALGKGACLVLDARQPAALPALQRGSKPRDGWRKEIVVPGGTALPARAATLPS